MLHNWQFICNKSKTKSVPARLKQIYKFWILHTNRILFFIFVIWCGLFTEHKKDLKKNKYYDMLIWSAAVLLCSFALILALFCQVYYVLRHKKRLFCFITKQKQFLREKRRTKIVIKTFWKRKKKKKIRFDLISRQNNEYFTGKKSGRINGCCVLTHSS